MKKLGIIAFLMLCVSCVVITSCGGSDDDGDGNTSITVSQIVGTWMCTASTDTYQGYESRDLMVGKQVTINSDYTYSSTASSFGATGTWALSGNQVTAKSSAGTFVLTATVTGTTMHWIGTASNGVKFDYYFTKEQ